MSALKRCLSRVADAAENTRAPQRVWILLFVAAWTLYNAISHLNLAITHDTAEAYVWGREFQWGYYKHPPFWAWVAGAWFAALPHNVWAFAALCAGVSGVGLLGVWRLYGALGRMQNRATAIHLSLLTPFYTFFALKYNANDIFLALWPWTAFAFVRSLERTALFYAVWFGVLSALCLLSKYYAVLLLGTCLIAAVIHPEKRTYFSSPRPYITIGVALLLVAPHLYWLVQAGFPSFQYFAEETGQGSARTVSQILSLISEVLLWHAPLVFWVIVVGKSDWRSWAPAWRRLSTNATSRTLLCLAAGPFLLTLLSVLVFRLSLSSNTTVAIYCLVPLVIAEVCEVRDAASLNRATSLAAAAIAIVALSIAPAIAYFGPHTLAPRQKLAAMVTALWHDKTKTRLSLVAGTRLYADEIAFYSSDNPSEFIGFSFEFAPWVSPAAIANNGFIAVCKDGDTQCIENASRFAGGGALPQRVNLPGTKEYFSVMSIVPAKGQ